MGIFDKRLNYKPFEYPEVMDFVESMNSSFWVHKEIDFTADIQDFKSNLSETEQEIVKRSLLSIAQVEIGVKLFWATCTGTSLNLNLIILVLLLQNVKLDTGKLMPD